MSSPRPGSIVLYSQGWKHDDSGRPHIVFAVCPSRGLRLCPVTSTPHRLRPPLDEDFMPARPGGFRKDCWVTAVPQHGELRNCLCWVDPSHVGPVVGQLTEEELQMAGMSALRQLTDCKRKLRRVQRTRQLVTA